MNGQLDMVLPELEETFAGGFRLGARMMIEVYQGTYPDKPGPPF